MAKAQLDLFDEAEVAVAEPEPMTTYRVGSREVKITLRRQRREACVKLMEILDELEGKDIHIGSYEAGGRHFWLNNLLLRRLSTERLLIGETPPSVIVLWGCRGAHVRIFTDYLVAVRVQEYFGYWHYLLDFRNGTWEYPIDNYRSHYACLTITRFKD